MRVIDRGFNRESGRGEEAEGKAFFVGEPTVGRLRVSFFGPFYGAYNVIELGEDYGYSMVTGADRSYFWILARTPSLDPEMLERLVARAAEPGFATGDFIYVTHDAADPAR